ncbi:unnamed protein product, partial [Rotaria socialis]
SQTAISSADSLAWWAVRSYTTSVEVLQGETFFGRQGMRTLFSIESQNGKSIVSQSYFRDADKEFVLMPGSYFEVIGQLNPTDGLYIIIQMKELESPFPCVKPPLNVSKPSYTIEASLNLNQCQKLVRVKFPAAQQQ